MPGDAADRHHPGGRPANLHRSNPRGSNPQTATGFLPVSITPIEASELRKGNWFLLPLQMRGLLVIRDPRIDRNGDLIVPVDHPGNLTVAFIPLRPDEKVGLLHPPAGEPNAIDTGRRDSDHADTAGHTGEETVP